MTSEWKVRFSTRAKGQYEKLKMNGKRPPINEMIDFLAIELRKGPERVDWPNYGPLSKNSYHCHLKKGKPTYVACWTVLDYKQKQIEVYYVGTHEGASY
jgi:hypothetical protein